MINPLVLITPEMLEVAELIGRSRCDAKPSFIRKNDSDYHSYNSDRAYPHIIGALAELAYSKLTNKQVDQQIYTYTGDKSDFDGVEIKSSTWNGKIIDLIVKQKEFHRKSPLAYILAKVDRDFNYVEFLGSITRERFDKEKQARKHKFIDNYCVQSDTLSRVLAVVKDGKLGALKFDY